MTVHLIPAVFALVCALIADEVAAQPPPAAMRFEETDPSITYTGDWLPTDPRPWSGGTAAYSEMAGARATFAFTGTSVRWIGFRGPQTGIALVSLDGRGPVQVDTYSPTEEVQAVLFIATGLADTNHTLTIEVTGGQNPASIAAYIVVDAFDVPRLESPPGDTTPPGRSSGRPTGMQPAGTREVTLSFATTEPATCRYAMTPGTAYSAMTGTLMRAGQGNFHIATLGGLADGRSYVVSARCRDDAGNVNADDYTIAFSVAAP